MINWVVRCKCCGAVEKWSAKDFFEAQDKFPQGWAYDGLMGGSVCPMRKID